MDITKQLAKNINIVFSKMEFATLEYKGELSVAAFNREYNKDKDKKDKEIFEHKQEIIDALEKQNIEQVEALEKHSSEIQIKTLLDKAFKSPIGNAEKLTSIPDNTVISIYGFKQIETKFGPSNIVVASADSKLSVNSILKTYRSIKYLNSHIQKRLDRFPALGNNCYGLCSGDPLFQINKLGNAWTSTGMQYALIDIRYINLDCANTLENLLIKPLGLNPKDCTGIEKLIADKSIKVGDLIKILGVRECGKQILLEIQAGDQSYNSYANFWLKEIYKAEKDKHKDNIPVLLLVVDIRKRTPQSKEEHTFIMDKKGTCIDATVRKKPIPVIDTVEIEEELVRTKPKKGIVTVSIENRTTVYNTCEINKNGSMRVLCSNILD
jgi:hypothetical protein